MMVAKRRHRSGGGNELDEYKRGDRPGEEVVRIVMGHHAAAKRERVRKMRREMTPAEAILWKYLRTNQLDGLHFRRQQVIDGFIADFYCHAARLVIEVDGEVHDQQPDYDAERDRILTARGLRILRFTNRSTAP